MSLLRCHNGHGPFDGSSVSVAACPECFADLQPINEDGSPEDPAPEKPRTFTIELDPEIAAAVGDGDLNPSDAGNAQRLVARHGPDLRYVHAQRAWFHWDGTCWREDDTGEVIRRAKLVVRDLWQEAGMVGQLGDARGAEKMMRHALRSENARRIAAMVELAESEAGVPIRPTDFDPDPWLLGCANGTLDLRDGTFHEPRREDLISKLCRASWDPDATAPQWSRFLDQTFRGDTATIGVVQRFLGSGLTGDTSERKFLLGYGPGRNGKSVAFETVGWVLGDYATTLPAAALMQARRDSTAPTPFVAGLLGARFARCSESVEGGKLDAALIKSLTGDEELVGRMLFRNPVRFQPTAKLALGTNHQPRVDATDQAVWDRLICVAFPHRVPDSDVDRDLAVKLRLEADGVLRWLVEGCRDWQHRGKDSGTSEAIQQAADSYRFDEDAVGRWIDDRCDHDPNDHALWSTSSVLTDDFNRWAQANGEDRLSATQLGKRLSSRGYDSDRRTTGVRIRRGIRLRQEDPS